MTGTNLKSMLGSQKHLYVQNSLHWPFQQSELRLFHCLAYNEDFSDKTFQIILNQMGFLRPRLPEEENGATSISLEYSLGMLLGQSTHHYQFSHYHYK